MATQFIVLLENRPGSLADLTSVLSEAGVNITAILLEGSVDFGVVRVHLDNARAGEKALKDAGYQYRKGETITLTLDDEPGSLAEITRKLAKAKVNIDCLFGTTSAESDKPQFVLMADDLAKAKKALGLDS